MPPAPLNPPLVREAARASENSEADLLTYLPTLRGTSPTTLEWTQQHDVQGASYNGDSTATTILLLRSTGFGLLHCGLNKQAVGGRPPYAPSRRTGCKW